MCWRSSRRRVRLLVLDLSPPDTAIELLDQIEGLPPVLVVSDTRHSSAVALSSISPKSAPKWSRASRLRFSWSLDLHVVEAHARRHRGRRSVRHLNA